MNLEGFELLSAVALGLGLAAAAGFRVFVPVLLAGLAARFGHLPLAAGFGWLDDTVVLMALAVAALVEVAAYFIPWFDNLLDAAAALCLLNGPLHGAGDGVGVHDDMALYVAGGPAHRLN